MLCAFFATDLGRANYFGSPYADGKAHDFFYDDDLTSREKSGMENARRYALDPTNMTTSVRTTYTTSVDVWAYNTWSPVGQQTGWYAWASCVRYVSGSSTKCNQFTITFNERLPHSNYAALACHEIGHTVGLTDGQPGANDGPVDTRSCMKGPPDFTAYSNHDRTHINARYY